MCLCLCLCGEDGDGMGSEGEGCVFMNDVRLGAYKFLHFSHSFYSFFSFICQVLVETFQSVLQSANQDHLRTFYVLGTHAQYGIAYSI